MRSTGGDAASRWRAHSAAAVPMVAALRTAFQNHTVVVRINDKSRAYMQRGADWACVRKWREMVHYIDVEAS